MDVFSLLLKETDPNKGVQRTIQINSLLKALVLLSKLVRGAKEPPQRTAVLEFFLKRAPVAIGSGLFFTQNTNIWEEFGPNTCLVPILVHLCSPIQNRFQHESF